MLLSLWRVSDARPTTKRTGLVHTNTGMAGGQRTHLQDPLTPCTARDSPQLAPLVLPPPGAASPRRLKCQDIPRSKPLPVLSSLPQCCHRSHSLEGSEDRKYPGSPALLGSGPFVAWPRPSTFLCLYWGSLQSRLGKSIHTKLCRPGAAQLHGLRKAARQEFPQLCHHAPSTVLALSLHINEMSPRCCTF